MSSDRSKAVSESRSGERPVGTLREVFPSQLALVERKKIPGIFW